jgi:uncharacterized protein YqeY
MDYNYEMLRSKLQDDQLRALKSGDRERLDTLRFILAQVKNKEIEKKAELNDEETIVVMQKFKRELNESIDAAQKAGRTELETQSRGQLAIVSEYLPAEMSDEELKKEIGRIISENKDVYDKNPKAIIGVVMKELKTKAESPRILQALNAAQKV